MEVRYHKQFEKDIDKYAWAHQFKEIFEFVALLEWIENLQQVWNIKKLADFKEFYRYRLSEYRIGFRMVDNVVQLDRFLHRKDIYKKYT